MTRLCSQLAVCAVLCAIAVVSVDGCNKPVKEFFTGPAKVEQKIEYKGCYKYGDVDHSVQKSDQMRQEICNSRCYKEGYKFMALSGKGCYCETLLVDADKVDDALCTSLCPGADSEKCGGDKHHFSGYTTGEK